MNRTDTRDRTDPSSVAEDERPVVPEAFSVRDGDAANWLVRKVVDARTHLPSAVAKVEHVLKNAVREHIAATGELPQGAQVDQGGEKFFVK